MRSRRFLPLWRKARELPGNIVNRRTGVSSVGRLPGRPVLLVLLLTSIGRMAARHRAPDRTARTDIVQIPWSWAVLTLSMGLAGNPARTAWLKTTHGRSAAEVNNATGDHRSAAGIKVHRLSVLDPQTDLLASNDSDRLSRRVCQHPADTGRLMTPGPVALTPRQAIWLPAGT